MLDLIDLLTHLAAAAERREPLDVEAAAQALGVDADVVERGLERLAGLGLAWVVAEDRVPFVTRAGQQVLDGLDVGQDALAVLPLYVDDLRARAALLTATRVLVGEYTEALAGGQGVAYAQQILPDAFTPVVDEPMAVRLFAAMAAVAARLSGSDPAACVAEELMAVAFIAEATSALEDEVEAGTLDVEDYESAKDELQGVFELFEDDDVLNLFLMEEPADAAVAAHDPTSIALGVVDQRVESWFDAFGGELPFGHLQVPDPAA